MSTTSLEHQRQLPAGPASTGQWLRELLTDRISRLLFVVLAAVITVGYTITLPFAVTQRWSAANWQFLTGNLRVPG